ncbi:MAG: hypothetical protein VXZ72_01240 [Chlamydiota bacterium]|nr:hypothetical protein [Chlamydiota bacterium]
MPSNETLKKWAEEGFFIGPDEPLQRVQQRRSQQLARSRGSLLSLPSEFHCCPHGIPVHSSSQGLAPWEAAATWISEEALPTIHIHPKPWFCQSSREEILHHEMVHALRAAFPPSSFEELLAHSLSKSSWRKKWGGLIHSTWESLLLLSGSLIAGVLSFLSPKASVTVYSLSFCYLTYLMLRNRRRHRLLDQAMQNITACFGEAAHSVAIRLTDEEILIMSRMNPEACRQYVLSQRSLRWQQILAQFPI